MCWDANLKLINSRINVEMNVFGWWPKCQFDKKNYRQIDVKLIQNCRQINVVLTIKSKLFELSNQGRFNRNLDAIFNHLFFIIHLKSIIGTHCTLLLLLFFLRGIDSGLLSSNVQNTKLWCEVVQCSNYKLQTWSFFPIDTPCCAQLHRRVVRYIFTRYTRLQNRYQNWGKNWCFKFKLRLMFHVDIEIDF